LGIGTKISRNRFCWVLRDGNGEYLTDVKGIFARYYRSYIIRNDGSLWGTGSNENGRLGSEILDMESISFVKLKDDAKVVDGRGHSHSVLVTEKNGVRTLWGTGKRSMGQFGSPVNFYPGYDYTTRFVEVLESSGN
jgi:alpha-tubulin suppressor-like RCC1 family protein